MKSLIYIYYYIKYNPLYREAVIKLQKTCHTINYSTDPPQYMSLDREGIPDLPVESMLNRLWGYLVNILFLCQLFYIINQTPD